VFELTSKNADGRALWAYRYRTGGRESERVQRGGLASEGDARAALERALEKLRRADGTARVLTLAELRTPGSQIQVGASRRPLALMGGTR
jgi:hypothetical protein